MWINHNVEVFIICRDARAAAPSIHAALIPFFTKLRFIFETTKNAEKKHIFAITENLKNIMDTSVTIHSISEYDEILRQAVAVIESSRNMVAKTIMSHINEMHWNIGKLLHDQKLEKGYGSAIVKHLSVDLKQRYPNMGMSERNLWDMKRFYSRFCKSELKLRQAVAVLPWWNINKLISTYEKDDAAILFYAEQTIEKNWSRDLLVNAIKLEMHKHIVTKNTSNNFSITLPETQAQYAIQVFKDTYNMGFLDVKEPILELELERRLMNKIKLFLLELGQGFTFIGNQHVLYYNSKEYKVDMLFFHRGLRSLIAVDLKIGEFQPEYVGKMNLYLSLLDKIEKGENENPSIGIILCAEKDNVEVELALDGYTKPIGVSDYQLIIPREELKQLISDEIRTFNTENI